MLSILQSELSSQYAQHMNDYHLNGILSSDLTLNGFFTREPFNVDDVKQQRFFDHTHCTSMNGFDYVTSWKTNEVGTQWCKTWKSGYIEQGGFADNVPGQDFIDIAFMKPYNYPLG